MGSIGDGGNISVKTGSLKLTDQSFFDTSTFGKGNGGGVNLNVSNLVSLDRSKIFSNVEENAIGNAGDIYINTGSLELKGNPNEAPRLQTSTKGIGNAGNIEIIADGTVTFDAGNVFSDVNENAIGNAGNIDIKAGFLTLTGRTVLLSTTRSQGKAGNFNIDVSNLMTIENGSLILSQVLTGGRGDAGDINITTGSLTSNNGLIIADSKDQGNGGDINITADDTILLQGTPIISDGISEDAKRYPAQIVTGLDENFNNETNILESAGKGKAGNINISAGQLIMNDLAFIISNIEKTTVGEAGKININVNRLRLANNAFISTFTENKFNAGSIAVNAQILELLSGGKLFTSTDGIGNAGNINLNITDSITIDNQIPSSVTINTSDREVLSQISNELQGRNGLFANATENATGNGGSIFIGTNSNLKPNQDIPNNITIANGAEINVDGGSQGSAGIIALAADSLSLDNASILAETSFGQQGNIKLQIANTITFQENSLISAQAMKNANGGNIDIDSPDGFVVAFPNQNNDIIANAEQGSGGNITINAQSVFGLQERPLNSVTNDINASSELGLNGSIKINTPDVDPFQETAEAPENVVEPDRVVAGVCDASQIAKDRPSMTNNSFIVNGKGGVPPEPTDPFAAETLLINGQSVEPDGETKALKEQYLPIMTDQGPIYPARGIVKKPDGSIYLSAYPTNNTQRVPNNSPNCRI